MIKLTKTKNDFYITDNPEFGWYDLFDGKDLKLRFRISNKIGSILEESFKKQEDKIKELEHDRSRSTS